ncbi:MAG: hypothetical protein ACK4QL_04425 [Pseudanabaenaceae cyanobacterium]
MANTEVEVAGLKTLLNLANDQLSAMAFATGVSALARKLSAVRI